MRQRIYDEATGRAKTVSVYQEVDRPPNTKLRHDPLRMPLQRLEQEIHSEVHKVEQENVGVEAGHKGEELAERGLQLGRTRCTAGDRTPASKALAGCGKKPSEPLTGPMRILPIRKRYRKIPILPVPIQFPGILQKKRIQRRYTQQMRQAQGQRMLREKSFGGIKFSLQEFVQKVKQSKGYLVVILGIGIPP